MRVAVADSLEAVPAPEWNRLAGASNPFVRHEFLRALEAHDCVGDRTGWWPQHLLAYDDAGHGERLVGAVPMYLKGNSLGEFVFDWAWAEAYERHGLAYYPKLVAAVPFTPVPGPRLLVEGGADRSRIAAALCEASVEVAQRHRISSVHWLFPAAHDAAELERSGLLARHGYQFHWHNPGYRDFGDYLCALNSKRRKQVRRERRDAAAAPVEIRLLDGRQADAATWDAYHRLYASTYDRKWGYPSLTAAFFKALGREMPDSVLLALARRDGRHVAGALFLVGDDALYGRHWGCTEYHPALHFEMCYYAAIEHCIARRLSRFEAGAQGEHKLHRGFLPTVTHSFHWIGHPAFRNAIAEFLTRERRGVAGYVADLGAHSPFREAPAPSVARAAGG